MACCKICNHAKRAEIEKAILLRNYGDTEVTLRSISEGYKVDLKDLQVHALMHMPLQENALKTANETESLVSQIKRREADILKQVMEDSYITFKNVGDKINMITAQHTTEKPTLVQLTKPVVELYLGASQSIRDTADKLMKMHLMVNGEKDEGLASLANLVSALRGD